MGSEQKDVIDNIVEEEKDAKDETKIVVAVNADSFVYDAETKKYRLTLKGVAAVVKSDLDTKTVTIEIDESAVNREKSDLTETHVDEILDEIEQNEQEIEENSKEKEEVNEVNEVNEPAKQENA